jgi:hypothetical protein
MRLPGDGIGGTGGAEDNEFSAVTIESEKRTIVTSLLPAVGVPAIGTVDAVVVIGLTTDRFCFKRVNILALSNETNSPRKQVLYPSAESS